MKEKLYKVCENSLFARIAAAKLGVDSAAITLGSTIHLHNTSAERFHSDRRWVRHEMKHIEQFRQYGFLRFIFLYTVESVRKGYFHNRFEQEARAAEMDT